MRKNGLYLIASLGAGAASPQDIAAIFGSDIAPSDADGCLMMGAERGKPVEPIVTPSNVRLMLGQVESGPAQESVDALTARLARAGADAAREPGEWLFADWDHRSHVLTLVASECLRHPCIVALESDRVAVAPDLPSLARLGWVNDSLDGEALLRAMRPGDSQRSVHRRTLLRQAVQLLPGERMVVSAQGMTIDAPDPVPLPALRQPGFAAAIAELDDLLRRIVRRQLEQSGDVAVLLSGGLDSSLVAALAAEERLPGQRVTCLTSAAWPGSGIKDETEWAAMVADHLGLPLVRVAPGPETPVYQLRAARLSGASGPMLAPLHFVYDALEEAALAAGAGLLLDGGFGELTVSGYRRRSGGTILQDLRRRIGARLAKGTNPADDFLVRASAAVRALPPAEKQVWQAEKTHPGAHGFALGFDKAALRTTDAADPRLRRSYPFRDRALGRLMAAFPEEYVAHGGIDRAPIRALLTGRVPDQVAMRETKQPFAPTYFALLAVQATSARALIPAQRRAGADEWLDLDWLDRQLEAAAGGATLSRAIWSQVHCTALFAEFIRWWRTDRIAA